jgi:hypothetical protein
MNDLIYLPVSLGEAIDKLTILDIKLNKINDHRKESVKIEFDILTDRLKEFVVKYKLYYNIMKQVNSDIWDMMDILRDSKISDEKYLIKCKECIEENDIRFRIKNKINYVSKSLLKEQKSYNILRIIFDLSSISDNEKIKLYVNIIKYYSFLYDEIVIWCNDINIEFLNETFNYDPTIIITTEKYDIVFVKHFDFNNENTIQEIYDKCEITNDVINKYFCNF